MRRVVVDCRPTLLAGNAWKESLRSLVAELDPQPVSVAAGTPEKANRSVWIPEHDRWERYLSVLVFLGSLAYLCLFRGYTSIEPDEGIVLQGAQRILQGQVLYRDFFTFLTPGSYYLTALLFKIFGNSFLVARSALAVFGSCMATITYLLARRVCSRRISLLAAGLLILTALPYRFLTLHNWDSTLWACLAVYFAVRLLESTHWIWVLALGSSLSLTCLFEQSKGAGLLLGLTAGFLLLTWTGGDAHVFNRRNLTCLAVGLVSPIAIAAAYFASRHAFVIMLRDWLWPLQHYSRANRVPYGFQNWSEAARETMFGSGSIAWRAFYTLVMSASFLVPILPLIALGLLIYQAIQIARGMSVPHAKYYIIVSAAISGLLFSVVTARADIIHFMYLLPLLAVLLAWIIEGRDIQGRVFKTVHPALRVYVVSAFLIFSLPLLMRVVSARHMTVTRRGVIATNGEDTVIDYVQKQVKPGETLLVYPYLPLYNYLSGTYAPTRYEYFQPGMNTTRQATEMLADLESRRVPWVLFEPAFAEKVPNSWPGTPLNSIITDPVADYITTHYRPCQVLSSPANWRFLFMVRKGVDCPK